MKKSGDCKLCKDIAIDYTKSDIVPKWFGSLRNAMITMMPNAGRGRGRVSVPYMFGRSTSYAVSGDRFWIGDSETDTIVL